LVGGAGGIDGELLVVNADAVTVGVWVGEEAGLENWIGGGFDAGGHVGWVEGDLLDFGEVVLCILVKDEFAYFTAWELFLGPHVGQVEDVDFLLLPKLFGFFWSHGLDFDGPLRIVTLLNGLVQVLLGIVGRVVGRIFLGDEFDALLGLHVKLAVNPIIVLVDELDGVAIITVHETIAVWDTSVTHQDHELVDGLWILREVVPEHGAVISVGEMSCWITFLGVNEVWKFGRISQEEDRCIVGHDVPIPLISPQLDRETSWITCKIVGSRLATNS
jgi:hypothetical protein